jgi:hypothetical protein
MLQFGTYPIYIVYSLHRQKAVEPLWGQYYKERETAKKSAAQDLFKLDFSKLGRDLKTANEKDRMIDAVFQWQVVEDLEPKYKKEIDVYEGTIKRTLTTISRTSIGKALLDLFGQTKTWIIPANWETPTAKTDLATDEQGGGVRIMFNPQAFTNVSVSPRSSGSAVEDTLFHELVHAMRFSQDRYFRRPLIKWEFNHNSEEFLAEELANVYHSSRGESDFYGTYLGPYKKKKEMYQYLAEDAELVMALKFFLKTEPLAKFTAKLNQPDYNPFRDYKEIEAQALKNFGVDKFMEF